MMKTFLHLKPLALAVLLAGVGFAAAADDGTVTIQDGVAAPDLYSEALASIAADRYGAIAGIVVIWEAELGGDEAWKTEFAAALNEATDPQLYDIQKATSYDTIRAILQGRDALLTLGGVIGTEALGDLNRDLVFTPVVPCRISDTRFDSDPNPGHTSGPTATTRRYLAHGTVQQLAPQGHTAGTGCTAPQGEPVGIHGNFTAAPFAAPISGRGNLRAWPFGGALPRVSLVNYEAGTNIANTASVGTCFLCAGGIDLNVTAQFHSTDFIVDVMGYYYPATMKPITPDCIRALSSVVAAPFNQWTAVDARCPANYRATGGGYQVIEGTLGRPGVWVDPIPLVDGTGQTIGWRSWVDNQASGPSRRVQTHAVCCRVPGF